jgi:23S rRNA (cytidine1920-2'-O)/16S rRNA (cytidine1409-2'-O)-methyltransferase
VADEVALEVLPGPSHVGRGALKLEGALDVFGVDPSGRVVVDVGASTGGFTQVLLARGAVRVYAVDVGRGQLHESLRNDPRVVVREKVNARYIGERDVDERCSLATIDISFISVTKVLAPLRAVLDEGADVVTLVKPQFEVGRFQVGRGGLVMDAALHRQSLRDVAWSAQHESGYAVAGACPSPVTGAEGNREFFLHLRAGGMALEEAALAALVTAAVELPGAES